MKYLLLIYTLTPTSGLTTLRPTGSTLTRALGVVVAFGCPNPDEVVDTLPLKRVVHQNP